MTPRHRAASALFVAASLGLTAVGCGEADPVTTSGPPREVALHDGEFCPEELPISPRATYGLGTDDAADAAPDLPAPDEAWACVYSEEDRAGPDDGGAWYAWVLASEPRRLDDDELAAFGSALGELAPPAATRACTDDLGPRFLVSYAADGDLTGVVVDGYGCGDVRLTDDPFTTPPGEAAQPGTVAGVLSGPDSLVQGVRGSR